MASASPPQLPPRGPENELHDVAAGLGWIVKAVNLISSGTINIDQRNPQGYTALMRTSFMGHSDVARILLDRGGRPSAAGDDGCTALHYSAQQGQLVITKMLVEAGADLQARTSDGHTHLHLAAKDKLVVKTSKDRHWEVMSVLIMAGANPNSRCVDGETPLNWAAQNGHKEGAQRFDSNGIALISANSYNSERSGVFLLQQKEGNSIGDQAAYVNLGDKRGPPPLLCALGAGSFPSSPRIVQSPINAGANTASIIAGVQTETGAANDTPLDMTNRFLRDKKTARDGEELTEKDLVRLEGIRRLLMRVEVVHAVSWRWPVETPSIVRTAEGEARTVAASAPLTRMLPLLRRRARRPGVLLAAQCRNSKKL
eukprot:g16436.t1